MAARRQEYERGTVPSEVIHLVLTADVQKNRIEWVLRGWGARKTSWLINFGKLWGETHDADVWDDLADLIKEPVEGRQIKRVFVDSGFRPGKKDIVPLNRVYDFCRRFPSLVRPTKGSSHSMRTPLLKAPIEVNRKGEGAKYGLMLYRLDTSVFKSEVHERIRRPDDQPGAWYLPEMSDSECEDYCRQIVSEVRVNLPSGRTQWTQISKDNHYLDCEAMQAAAAYSLNAERWSPRENTAPPPPRSSQSPAPSSIVRDDPMEPPSNRSMPVKRRSIASQLAGYGNYERKS